MMIGTMPEEDAELYRSVGPALMSFATGLVGRSDAEDVVAGAVLRAFTSSTWPTVGNRKAYLYRAVFNEAQTMLRRQASLDRRHRLAATDDRWDLPDLHPEVLAAVHDLSVQQRAVILLTYWADLPPFAVAEHLGVSEGTVRRQLARARARLRKVLR